MSKLYSIGLQDIKVKLASPKAGTVAEVDTLTLSGTASATGNLIIYLDGVGVPVAVTADDTAAEIGDLVRLVTFTGWTVTGTGAEVIFTADTDGYRDAPVFNANLTGIGGTFVRTTLGEGYVFGDSRSIGEVAEGSTQFVQEAPSETKFKGDYGDITLFTLFQNGDITLETDIVEVNGAKMAALTGAAFDYDTKTVSLPESAPVIYGEVILTFDVGFDSIKIYRGQLVANLSGANVKTEMFKLHLKVVAVPDDAGFVDIVTEA